MVSDKGGWCYWRCGGRAPLNYLLERDMLRHRFPFLAGEDTPQTTLSHPLVTPKGGLESIKNQSWSSILWRAGKCTVDPSIHWFELLIVSLTSQKYLLYFQLQRCHLVFPPSSSRALSPVRLYLSGMHAPPQKFFTRPSVFYIL